MSTGGILMLCNRYTISGFDAFTTTELIAVDSNGALKARSIDSATWSDYNLGGGPLTIPTDFKLSVVADTMIFSNPNTGEVRWGLGFDPSTIYNNMPTLALPEGYQILGTFGVFNGGWDELVIINPTTGDVKRRKLNSTPPDSSWTDAGSVGPIPANHELVGVRYIVADRNNKTIDNSKLHVVVMTPAENDATYTVAYDDNGSASGTIPTDSNTYATDASVTVSENTGNLNISDTITFAGWNTKADGSGTNYAPGDTFNMGVKSQLFAQWKTTFEGDLTTDQTFIRPSTPADRNADY